MDNELIKLVFSTLGGAGISVIVLYWILNQLLPAIMKQSAEHLEVQRQHDLEQRKLDRESAYKAYELLTKDWSNVIRHFEGEAKEVKQAITILSETIKNIKG